MLLRERNSGFGAAQHSVLLLLDSTPYVRHHTDNIGIASVNNSALSTNTKLGGQVCAIEDRVDSHDG